MTNELVKIPFEDGSERLFRECSAVVTEWHVNRDPKSIRVLAGGDTVQCGDRLEMIKVLIPEACFASD